MAAFFQDFKYGARLLFRNRGFTFVAALVLALGIGANTAVFSIVNTMLLKPRPGVPDAELAGVFSRDRTQADAYREFSYPNYVDLRDRKDLFLSLTAHTYAMLGLTEGTVTRRVFVDVITSNYFDTFGVPVHKGRAFTLDEERPKTNIPVAIISYGMWQRLGAADSVINSTIRLNGRLFTVVGVAAPNFGGSIVLVSPELFVPTGVYDSVSNDFARDGRTTSLAERRHHTLVLVGRMKPGATIASLTPTLDIIGNQLEQAYPGENKNQTLSLAPLSRLSVSTKPQTDDEVGRMAMLLFSMSGLVLLVASFNLANMLLARGGARQKEFAIRLAIGGNRFRLVRQLLAESVVLALVGGVVATMAAWWSTRLLVSSMSGHSPISITFDTTPDVRVLVATVGLCLLSALLFGLGPAWRHAKTDAVPELKDQAGELTGRRRSRFSARNVLVMGQLALSLVTLTAAGMFVRTAADAAVADPGFTFERGIMANVDPSLAGRDPVASRLFYERALARLRAMPGVTSVSVASLMPFSEFTEAKEIQKAGAPLRRAGSGSTSSFGAGGGPDISDKVDGLVNAIFSSVGADYFKTVGLDLKQGREFTTAEELTPSDNRIAIIDQTLAARLFGTASPLGQFVQWEGVEGKNPVARVVGVVAPSHHQLLEGAMPPHIYTPFGQDFRTSAYLHLRTSAPTAQAEIAMIQGVRRELLGVDPELPIVSLETRPMFRDRNFMLWVLRAGAKIFVAFGLLALFMSVIGVYGVKAYVVARRTREIGIRVALGATPRGIVGMVIKDGIVTTAIGLIIGLGLSVLVAFALRSVLVGDGHFDTPVVVAAVLALTGAVILAAWLPARRATRVAATTAIRSE